MDVLDNDLKNADNGALAYAQKWALYGIAVAIIVGLVAFLVSPPDYSSYETLKESQSSVMNTLNSILGFVVFIVAIAMATRERASDFGRGFSFGKAWGTGTLTGVIFAIALGVWVFIYMTFIDPQSVDAAQMAMEAAWEEQGMSDEQIEQAASWAGMFSGAGPGAIMAAIMYSIFGMLISLITGAIFKKD